MLVVHFASGAQVIRKCYVRANKDQIADLHTFPNTDAVLNGNIITYLHACLDEGMISNVASCSDDRPLHNMSKSPDTCTSANILRFDEGVRMDKNFILLRHLLPVYLSPRKSSPASEPLPLQFFHH